MAFDTMGNWDGGYMLTPMEDEEERRRRLGLAPSAEPSPVKQTITTDPRTGEQKMKIEGSVRDLSAANPLTPTVTAPVSPDMLGIRQVESGNRDYDQYGRPIVSPKGAMYASQVMPATAAAPGFGVRPAQDQSAAEYNRVGQDYFNALLQRYGGDREKALAAYNAGPGRVDRNLAANQGQLNVGQLPTETQGYIPRVMNRIAGSVFPAAQAAPAPTAQAAPNAMMRTPAQEAADDERIFQATGVRPQPSGAIAPTANAQPLGQGLRVGDFSRVGVQLGANGDNQRLIDAGNDPDKLVALAADQNVDPNIRQIAQRLHASAIRQTDQRANTEKEIQEKLRTGDNLGLTKMLQDKGQGSWARAILFGYTGAQDLAREELSKLGYGATPSITEVNGNQAYINTTPMGVPTEGYYISGPKAGQALAPEELALGAQGVLGRNVSLSAEVYLDPTTNRRYRSGYDSKTGKSGLVDIQGGPMYRGDPKNLVLQRLDTSRQISDYQLVNDLKKRHGGNVIDAEKEYTAIHGPFRDSNERQQFYNLYQYGGAAPTTTPQQVPGAAPGAQPPVAGPAVPGAQPPAAAPGAQPAATGGVSIPPPNPNLGTGTAAAKQALENQGRRTADFNKKIDTDYAEEGVKADTVSSARKRQIDILQRIDPTTGRPVGDAISGYLTAPADSKTAQTMTIIRDLIARGAPEAKIRERLASLGLSANAQSALREFEAENIRIAANTLKEIAGPGAVSEAEQRVNREANLDIGSTPILGTYNIIAQSQFAADMKRYKSDYAAGTGHTATNVGQFEREWRRIAQDLSKSYLDMARRRADYIQKNGSSPDAVRKAYELYPVPQYDPSLNDGQGGWRYLRPLDQIMGPR